MSETLTRVYDALLMDHIRAARNYGALLQCQPVTRITNPLCGDQLQVQTEWQSGVLATIRFECECCGISMGSASLMTTLVTGRDPASLRALVDHALATLGGTAAAPQHAPADLPRSTVTDQIAGGSVAAGDDPAGAAAWALLDDIRRHLPARRTCAALGWQALQANLDGLHDVMAHEVRG